MKDDAKIFLEFHYPELKDLGKHFLTISSATAVFIVTFSDKISGLTSGTVATPSPIVKLSTVALLMAIVSAGTGLLVNYVAGAGASGAIVWGFGRRYRRLTGLTYVLYLLAGSGLAIAYIALAMTVLLK